MYYLPTRVAMYSCVCYIWNKDIKPKEQVMWFTLLRMLCTLGTMLHSPGGRSIFVNYYLVLCYLQKENVPFRKYFYRVI